MVLIDYEKYIGQVNLGESESKKININKSGEKHVILCIWVLFGTQPNENRKNPVEP